MDRNREARRVTMAAAGNGLSRRRHRAGSFRDSPEPDGPVELPEAARLRDRGGSMKKDRDRDRERDRERERDHRLNSRSKRRRGERLMVMHGNMDDGGDDSSEESVNDDEEYDDGGGGGGGPPKILPPANNSTTASFSSSLSNHHNSSGSLHHRKSFPPAKVFRSSPSPAATPAAAAASPLATQWKAADEMIGVSVPRKARSASTKRPHESYASGGTGGGIFASGEQIHRQVSTSPARASPASMLTTPSPPAPPSPSSSSVSVRKKMPSGSKHKSVPLKSSSGKSSSSPVAAQEEIEIEIAEVLYGMMRQPLGPSKPEVAGNDSGEAGNVNPGIRSTGEVKSRVSSPISNSQATVPHSTHSLAQNLSSSNVSAIAPKRKKPRSIKNEDENNSALPPRVGAISSTVKSEAEATLRTEAPSPNQGKFSGFPAENSSGLDSTNAPGLPVTAERESKLPLDSRPGAIEEPERKEKNLSKEETLSPKVECSGIRSDGHGVIMTASKALPAPEKEKFQIDLMEPPPARSSPERDVEMECVAAEPKPKAMDEETVAKPLLKEDECKVEKVGCKEDAISEPGGKKPRTAVETEPQKPEKNIELKLDLEKPDRQTASVATGGNKFNHQKLPQQLPTAEKAGPLPLHLSMPGWPGGLPAMGYMAPPSQGVVPTDTSSLPSATTMQPPHLAFNQPRPKRCATHCYIARNIHYHQQFTKMNPFWPGAAGSSPLYGTKGCNLSLMPSTELQGNVLGRNSNSVQDKSSQSTSNSSDGAQRKHQQILLQQALPPGAASNILHGPAFIFPLGQQPHAAAAIAAASVRPPISGNAASSGATSTSASVNGSTCANPAGATTMSFSYPSIPGNETQYLAILQNNGYSFPVPAHVGAPPAYRGAPGQPIPFFNGSFYPSQMIHPPHLQPQQQPQSGQAQQSPASINQNPSFSSGSSVAPKHSQNQQQRPPIMNSGNHPQGFPAQKVQSQPLGIQQRQQQRENATQQSETAGEDSPSTADSRASSRSNVVYGQNFPMPMQPTNFGLINSASSGGNVAVSGNSHGEKKPQQQQGAKNNVESLQSQAYAMTFATLNGATTAPTGLNIPSFAQNHAIFHSMPEATRQGYHQMVAAAVAAQAAQQKIHYGTSEDGKPRPSASVSGADERKTGTPGKSATNVGQSIAFSRPDLTDAAVSSVAGNSSVDSSARLLNLSSSAPRNASSAPTSQQQQLQRNQQQQQQQQQQQHILHLQKQQQYAAAAAAAAARSKGPVTSNGSMFSEHNAPASSVAAKYPNAISGFPQNFVQSSSSPIQSPQWKSSSPRPTTTQVQSASILSSSPALSLKNVHQKHQGRPQHAQISFAANSKSLPSGPPLQQPPSVNQSPSPPMMVGSPSNSMSKSTGGSPRTSASTSTLNKAGQASSTLPSSQPSRNSPAPPSVTNQSSTPVGGGRNGPSILGNPHVTPTSTTTTTKSQPQQQQPPKHALQQHQLFFTGAYMQPPLQSHHHHHHPPPTSGSISMSTASGYYLQRHQPQQQQQPLSSPATSHLSNHNVSTTAAATAAITATNDPAKAIAAAAAAAAAANNMKGGNLHSQGVPHSTASYTSSTQPPSGKMHHQLGPPGFTYIQAVQVKPADQKQPASE